MTSKVVVATEKDLPKAVRHALHHAGCTAEQLLAQAQQNDFESIQARLAWVAIGDLL